MSSQATTPPEAGRLALVRTSEPGRPGDETSDFASAVREGLLGRPKTLPFQYLYDETGSGLFEEICRTPEYYLTRTEDAILRDHAGAMVAGWDAAPTLIELGSGSAEKTRRLIAAALQRYGRLHYVPIDVSETAVEASARRLTRAFPALRVTGYVGDYHESLAGVAAHFRGPKLLIFLGSSLGNYEPEAALALLDRLAGLLGPEDRFLLGTDLAKDAEILEPAYDDAAGVTARFSLNLLTRINRELDADFDLDRFRHRATYRPEFGRVEINIVSQVGQTVRVAGAGVTVHFEAGEPIHTEDSHKYTLEGLAELAGQSGFREEAAWTDARGWFRVQRWQPLARAD